MFEGGVGGQDGVVGFDHGGGNPGRRVHRELQLGLFGIFYTESFHQQRSEA